MCVIIVKPKGKKLSIEEISKAWDRNSDGGGIAYIKDGKFEIFKTLEKDKYLNYYRQIEDEKNKNILLHMRIKTHGEVDIENTHPFETKHNLLFAHNGVITPEGKDKDKSDTVSFRDNILNNLPDKWWKNEAIKKLMAEYIGYSKLAFLTIEDEFFFINEEKGEWYDGIWYSNRYHATTRVIVYGTNNKNNTTVRYGTKIEKRSSVEILRDAYKSNRISLGEVARAFYENGSQLCWECGVPLVTREEAIYGLCSSCLGDVHAKD